MKRICLLLIVSLALACSKIPEPIVYGADMCNFCQMTIVTKTHAAQMVTDKGKQYKFDAIECMIHFLQDKQDLLSKSQLLITDYKTPGTMIDAKTAGYLVSSKITSPMGANLSGFNSIDTAKQTINDDQANYYDWERIFIKLNE
ncbi:nitrous oxide reductase accessory protein NosL [uncultured Psychroserpens sp.]|uniref:nitrous oxide reductase accessory protein NosL n=1 Tax=uncultured Psychroserpens sp. TaxID=255436 RepID=UPI0026114F66|nr:nitrous oxide reductase accessory protein NosL [uncultured Psychroserpens sp.]